MTKKDYVEIARILNRHLGDADQELVGQIVDDFARLFRADNPRFDRDRFLAAVIAPRRG